MAEDKGAPAAALDEKRVRAVLADVANGVRWDDIIKNHKVEESALFSLISNPDISAALQVAQRARLVIAADDAIHHLRMLVRASPRTEGDKARRLEAAKAILDRAGHSAGQAKNAADTASKAAAAPSVDELEKALADAKAAAADAARTIDVKPVSAQDSAQDDTQALDLLS